MLCWQPFLHVQPLPHLQCPMPSHLSPPEQNQLLYSMAPNLLPPNFPPSFLLTLPPMETKGLKHRPKDEPTNIPSTTTSTTATVKNRKVQKLVMAKRGLRSLVIAIVVPFILATLAACICGTATIAAVSSRFWYPPVWAFHVASIIASCLMGLSAWLVWADGGFHRRPITLALFLAQFILGLAWGPLVFRLGAVRVGLVVCIILFAAVYTCSWSFYRVNPIAGDLIKPYLAWVSFLALFNYKLV